jgi:hypothetical protein
LLILIENITVIIISLVVRKIITGQLLVSFLIIKTGNYKLPNIIIIIIAKITIITVINHFVIIVITNNRFDNALTEILQFRRALEQRYGLRTNFVFFKRNLFLGFSPSLEVIVSFLFNYL